MVWRFERRCGTVSFMIDDVTATITVQPRGPYLVSGSVPLALTTITPDDAGGSWTWTEGRAIEAGEKYALCRCGLSAKKPFCDGSHVKATFDSAEIASRATHREQATVTDGPALVLEDAEALCALARFCDNRGKIWNLIEKTDSPQTREIVDHEATHCPSGRLVVRDRATGVAVEPTFIKSIGVVEDPAMNCSGPLYVRGGIPIASADGTPYETRNRVALCRCGRSENRPFCDGSHTSGFRDGLA
jgi:CDGSH-type Zn-finger protein